MLRGKYKEFWRRIARDYRKVAVYFAIVALVFTIMVPLSGDRNQEKTGIISGAKLEQPGSGRTSQTNEAVQKEMLQNETLQKGETPETEPGTGPKTEAKEAVPGQETEQKPEQEPEGSFVESGRDEGPEAEGEEQIEPVTGTVAGDISNMVWPAEGEIIRGWGISYSQTFGDFRYHDGVDIKAGIGTKVKAIMSGRVSLIGESDNEGKIITIDHGNGWQSFYSHLGELSLQAGEMIEGGQVIGLIGEPGLAERKEGTHLHFVLIKDGKKVDPLLHLGADAFNSTGATAEF